MMRADGWEMNWPPNLLPVRYCHWLLGGSRSTVSGWEGCHADDPAMLSM